MSTSWFEECGICGQGVLLAVVDKEGGELQALCDECENHWRSPLESVEEKALSGEIKDVRMATDDEWLAAGWTPKGQLSRTLKF